jgi:hypothetical protein
MASLSSHGIANEMRTRIGYPVDQPPVQIIRLGERTIQVWPDRHDLKESRVAREEFRKLAMNEKIALFEEGNVQGSLDNKGLLLPLDDKVISRFMSCLAIAAELRSLNPDVMKRGIRRFFEAILFSPDSSVDKDLEVWGKANQFYRANLPPSKMPEALYISRQFVLKIGNYINNNSAVDDLVNYVYKNGDHFVGIIVEYAKLFLKDVLLSKSLTQEEKRHFLQMFSPKQPNIKYDDKCDEIRERLYADIITSKLNIIPDEKEIVVYIGASHVTPLIKRLLDLQKNNSQCSSVTSPSTPSAPPTSPPSQESTRPFI